MPGLSHISPFFIIAQLQPAVSFYVDKLGFEVLYTGPEGDPFFAMVGRDNVSIMLRCITEKVGPVPNHTRHEWARWDTFIYVAEPDVLYDEYRKRGLAFYGDIQNDGDGLRGFEIEDADGYVLFFGRPWP